MRYNGIFVDLWSQYTLQGALDFNYFLHLIGTYCLLIIRFAVVVIDRSKCVRPRDLSYSREFLSIFQHHLTQKKNGKYPEKSYLNYHIPIFFFSKFQPILFYALYLPKSLSSNYLCHAPPLQTFSFICFFLPRPDKCTCNILILIFYMLTQDLCCCVVGAQTSGGCSQIQKTTGHLTTIVFNLTHQESDVLKLRGVTSINQNQVPIKNIYNYRLADLNPFIDPPLIEIQIITGYANSYQLKIL